MTNNTRQSDGGAPSDEPDGSVFSLTACPYCGGETGFAYRLTLRGDQFMPWRGSKGTPRFEDTGRRSQHGAYRCADCGRIIRPNA